MRSSDEPSKLFVGEIGDNRKSDISRLFSKYGEISTIYVDDHKHFAFVEFTSSSDAQRALKHTHNKTVNGARLRVEYAKPDKPARESRRAVSREHSPTSALYNHLQVTANRLPSMRSVRQNFYQPHQSPMMINSAMSRGRSLTPPSLKQNARLPSMNHLRTQDFYSPYYPPPHPAVYADPAYYRTYADPYLMQRLPPPIFLPPPSSPPPPSSSSRAYRNMYSSSDLDRYPSVTSHKRTRRSRSPTRRRNSTSRRNRSSRERKRKRRTPSPSTPQQRPERGPQTPPPSSSSSSHRSKKRTRSNSETVPSAAEQKSSSPSVIEDEGEEDKQSNSKRSQDDDADRKHAKRRTNE